MLISSLQGLLQNQNPETILICIVVLYFPHDNIVWIHMCDECTRSNVPSVRHKVLSILWPHEQVCSQTTNIRSPNTSQIQTFQKKLWTNCRQFSCWLIFLIFELMVIHAWRRDFVLFYSPVRNILPRISLRDLPCRRTKKIWFLHEVSLKLLQVVFLWLQQKSWLRTYLCMLSQCHYWLYILFEYNPNFRGRGMMLVLPDQRLSLEISKSVKYFLFCLPFGYRPHFQMRKVLSLGWPKNIPNKNFSQPCSNITFSNCLSHNSPAKGWPYKFPPRTTTGSSILEHDLGHLCFGRCIQISGQSDFGIFNNFWCIFHFDLRKSGCSIGCLAWTSWKSGYNVHYFCGCHLGCWWSLFSEYCVRTRIIVYCVASEYDPALKLLNWGTLRGVTFLGPIRFPQHLFSVHDHGRLRSSWEPQLFPALAWAWLYIEPSPCGGVRPAGDPVDSDPGAVFEDDPHPRSDAGRPLELWVCHHTREPTVLSRLSCRPPHLNVDRFHQPCLFPGRTSRIGEDCRPRTPWRPLSLFGQPGSSSFASH